MNTAFEIQDQYKEFRGAEPPPPQTNIICSKGLYSPEPLISGFEPTWFRVQVTLLYFHLGHCDTEDLGPVYTGPTEYWALWNVTEYMHA